MDDSIDVVGEVNALLKLDVGDSYRLEHIKQAFIQNKSIWVTDENYLKRLREKYLVKQTPDVNLDGEIVFENEPKEKETIHCWKCGKKGPLDANFCMTCGTAIFEINEASQLAEKSKSDNPRFVKSRRFKVGVFVGIPILILMILVGIDTGNFDGPSVVAPIPATVPAAVNDGPLPDDTDSKCGPGTVFDTDSNSCVLGTSPSDDSKCGPGTVFDAGSNSCVLG